MSTDNVIASCNHGSVSAQDHSAVSGPAAYGSGGDLRTSRSSHRVSGTLPHQRAVRLYDSRRWNSLAVPSQGIDSCWRSRE
jgi:hypothetical protein